MGIVVAWCIKRSESKKGCNYFTAGTEVLGLQSDELFCRVLRN